MSANMAKISSSAVLDRKGSSNAAAEKRISKDALSGLDNGKLLSLWRSHAGSQRRGQAAVKSSRAAQHASKSVIDYVPCIISTLPDSCVRGFIADRSPNRERRVKCDETLPTCQRCQRSGRVCKGLWGKTSTKLQTLAPSSTPPAANTRAMAASSEYSRLSAEAEPPISSPDSDNRPWTELTWVESSTSNTGLGRTSAEPGASAGIDSSGLEKGRAKDLIWVEEPVWQRGENIQGSRSNGQPDGQGGDSGPSTSMVGMDHSTPSANSSKQTTPEGDLSDGANISRRNSVVAKREGSENTLTTKVVKIYHLSHLIFANVFAENRR